MHVRHLALLVALAGTACSGGESHTSDAGPPPNVRCGHLAVTDVVEDPAHLETTRAQDVCFQPFVCGGKRTSLQLDAGCWLELDGTATEGTVVAGTGCTRTYPGTAGVITETLTSASGTYHAQGQGIRLTVHWLRETRDPQGNGTSGHSDWTLDLTPEHRDVTALDDSCGRRATPPESADAAAIAGCTSGTFVDRRAASAERIIRFGGEHGSHYDPRCMRIAVGQSVQWEGDFAQYVLGPGTFGAAGAGSQPNPIVFSPAGTSREFTFQKAGDYLFHSTNHEADDMQGLVRVGP